jgi:DNA-directed RNA polymerase subunit RPC12/RpoP
MKRLMHKWKRSASIGIEYARMGFRPSREKCANCGRRVHMMRRGLEYKCIKCSWGALYPETVAEMTNILERSHSR